MVTAFREQVTLLPSAGRIDPLRMWWPSGVYKRWRNARIMTDYLGRVLEERFAKQNESAKGVGLQKKERKRVVVDLALQEYENLQAEEKSASARTSGIDESFKKAAITQIRTFIFAGRTPHIYAVVMGTLTTDDAQDTIRPARRSATPCTYSRRTRHVSPVFATSMTKFWVRSMRRQTRSSATRTS